MENDSGRTVYVNITGVGTGTGLERKILEGKEIKVSGGEHCLDFEVDYTCMSFSRTIERDKCFKIEYQTKDKKNKEAIYYLEGENYNPEKPIECKVSVVKGTLVDGNPPNILNVQHLTFKKYLTLNDENASKGEGSIAEISDKTSGHGDPSADFVGEQSQTAISQTPERRGDKPDETLNEKIEAAYNKGCNDTRSKYDQEFAAKIEAARKEGYEQGLKDKDSEEYNRGFGEAKDQAIVGMKKLQDEKNAAIEMAKELEQKAQTLENMLQQKGEEISRLTEKIGETETEKAQYESLLSSMQEIVHEKEAGYERESKRYKTRFKKVNIRLLETKTRLNKLTRNLYDLAELGKDATLDEVIAKIRKEVIKAGGLQLSFKGEEEQRPEFYIKSDEIGEIEIGEEKISQTKMLQTKAYINITKALENDKLPYDKEMAMVCVVEKLIQNYPGIGIDYTVPQVLDQVTALIKKGPKEVYNENIGEIDRDIMSNVLAQGLFDEKNDITNGNIGILQARVYEICEAILAVPKEKMPKLQAILEKNFEIYKKRDYHPKQ